MTVKADHLGISDSAGIWYGTDNSLDRRHVRH